MVALGVIGVAMLHHPMLLTGMATVQTDPGDPRLIAYLLEHTYLWARQAPAHPDLWSPPFFFPAPNVAAYSDLLLSVAPPYWALRAAGLEPDSAFQAWMIAVSALNYLALLALLRRGYRFAWPAAAAGAFLIAFAAPRTNQLQHQQLMPAFFVAATLLALARLLDRPPPGRAARWAWWQVAAGGVVAQLYAAFYVGWFLILALGVAAAWGLALPGSRGHLLGVLRRDAAAIVAATLAGGLALVPFLAHYLAAAREVGARDFTFVHLSLLLPWSWVDMGPGHWLAGWTAGAKVFGNDFLGSERHAGLGLVTPAVCALGWWLGRHRPLVRVAAPTALTLALLATRLPGDAIADLALAAAALLAARLYRQRPGPRLAAVAVGLLVAAATAARSPTWRELGLGVFLLLLCLLEAGHARHRPARLAAAALLALALAYRLLDLGWIDYPDRPEVWGAALLTPVALRLARARPWDRATPGPLVAALAVALATMALLEGRDSLWYLVFHYVPGGQAVRAVGRVALAVLVPAAIGAAAFFSSPWAARRPVVAGLIGLACLLEQGVTTTAYDKAAERGRIAYLSRLVDPAAPAFYYRPAITATHSYQLDAMWMSLRTGVPTVNGYSGGWPRAWHPLLRADDPAGPTPRAALAGWLEANGMTPGQVQAIGDALDRRAGSR